MHYLFSNNDNTITLIEGEGTYTIDSLTFIPLSGIHHISNLVAIRNESTTPLTIKISNCYKITEIHFSSENPSYGANYIGNIESLSYAENLKTFVIYGHKCLSNIKLNKLTNLTRFAFLTDIFTPIEEMVSLELENVDAKLIGDIKDLGKFTKLNYFYNYEGNLTGSLESYVELMVANGVITHNAFRFVTFDVANINRLNKITFGGNLLTFSENKPDAFLSWDYSDTSNKKIILYNQPWSKTVNFNYLELTDVYCKNATQEEIDKWKSNGKIVHVIE